MHTDRHTDHCENNLHGTGSDETAVHTRQSQEVPQQMISETVTRQIAFQFEIGVQTVADILRGPQDVLAHFSHWLYSCKQQLLVLLAFNVLRFAIT